ncbi:LacI family DNA-binding transcriptional regulator [Clostridium pasteurianum]|uniref:Transcriptional regulator n=1 Tax=Clostridium pasteurianum BC1 TaxID=86416 RepID=R4K9X9_CLOPA|nr:LacI family DNA-binding transcriptional regulator [Clostridium pasteurianum]AGK98486.1 transcriptional regulator [Clostridium pasteurianum BC1]
MIVTIKDVARKAGVSAATVSRVINNSKPVNEELRRKVDKVIKDMNYTPNVITRNFLLNQTKLIGVVIPYVSNQFHSIALEGIDEVAAKYGYSIIICNIYQSIEKEYKYFEILKERQVDGVILMHENTEEEIRNFLSERNIPIVLASVTVKGMILPTVRIDEVKAAYDATKYFIKNEHNIVAMICGNGVTAGEYRKLGYIKALKDYGRKIDERYIMQGDFDVKSGYENMKKLLELEKIPTAVFAASDEIAIGAINCIYDFGYKVPEDISLIGFDDIELASVFRPHLTTIRQPIKKIGQGATEMLIKILNNEKIENYDEILDHELIIRQTTK